MSLTEAGEQTRPRSVPRLAIILALGLVAIGAALAVRQSPWARERRLESMNLEELALAIHDHPTDPLTLYHYGRALLKAGQVDASQRALETAVKLDPRMYRARVGLGSVLLERGDLRRAVDEFQQAVKLQPREPEAHVGLSQAYYRAASPARAIEPLKKVVQLQPRSAAAWYNLGKLYGEAHQSDHALEAMKKAVAIDPDVAAYWRDLGRLHRHYSQNKEAEAAYKKALKLDDSDPVAWYWLGQLYVEMSDSPEYRGYAEQSLLRAISRAPDMAEAHFELGRLYERRGSYALAAARFREATRLDMSDDKALYHLGLALTKMGSREEGQKLIRGAQALGAAKREIKNLENRIRAEAGNRGLRLRIARLYRKYGNAEAALSQYTVHRSMGAPDAAVEKEEAAYREELRRANALPAQELSALPPAPAP